MCNDLVWHRRVLSNGLRVLFLSKPSANTVQLSVAVEFGSNMEEKAEAGLAHFLEHMLAGGSDERIQKSRSIESYGGSLNFYTDHEHTMSFVDVLPESLPQAAQILSELLFDDRFDEEKFVSERAIILHELAEALDDPAVLVDELFLKALFKDHPVSRPIGGYPKTLKKLSLSQLEAIHKAVYVPQNMILILMGNLSNSQIQEGLKHFENKLKQQKLIRHMQMPKSVNPVKRVSKSKQGLTQTYLNIGAQTVNAKNVDAPKLDLISMILGGGASSRLFIELREKRALTYDVVATHVKGLDFGHLSVSCAVKNSNVNKTCELIFDEFAKLRTEEILEEELERNKKLMLSGILRGIDNPGICQDIIAYMEIQYNNENALTDYLNKIKTTTTADILNTAQTYLKKDNFNTAILKPK
jgi:predicted Zn-dependent peptidase